MSRFSKLLFIAVCCVVIATPFIRYKLKAQVYLENLSSGVILEATQRLRGGIFKDTKILLIDHLPEGSTGVVLNETFEEGVERFKQIKLGTNVKSRLQALENIQHDKDGLYWGGPVAPSHLYWVGYHPETGEVSMHGNKQPEDFDDESTVVARFVGYAGWGANQLEQEISKGGWRVSHASPKQISQWLLANNSNKKSVSE